MIAKSDQQSEQKKGMPESPTGKLQYLQDVGSSKPRMLRKSRMGMVFQNHLLFVRVTAG